MNGWMDVVEGHFQVMPLMTDEKKKKKLKWSVRAYYPFPSKLFIYFVIWVFNFSYLNGSFWGFSLEKKKNLTSNVLCLFLMLCDHSIDNMLLAIIAALMGVRSAFVRPHLSFCTIDHLL